jgi:hypothetical protein
MKNEMKNKKGYLGLILIVVFEKTRGGKFELIWFLVTIFFSIFRFFDFSIFRFFFSAEKKFNSCIIKFAVLDHES